MNNTLNSSESVENTFQLRRLKKENEDTKKAKWKERVVQVQRVSKVVKGGKKLSFRATVIIGNYQGEVGVGIGKADEVSNAVKKASHDANKKIIKIFLTKGESIPHLTQGFLGASQVFLRPAAVGTGVIAGSSIRLVLELAGIRNILAKQLGAGNLLNNARATIVALKSLRTPHQIASQREISLEKLYGCEKS